MSRAVLATVCLAFFMTMLDTTIVNIAIPDLQAGLGASLDQALWVLNGYTLAFAGLLLTFGRLGDRFGHRSVFLAGLAVFTIASGLCGLAQDPAQLIAVRVLQGAGAALLMPQTLSIIMAVFPPDRRGAAFGVWSGVAGLATIAGPAVGGVLVDTLTWRSVFLINLPLGVLAFVAARIVVPPGGSPGQGRAALDPIGVLLSAGLSVLVFALLGGEPYLAVLGGLLLLAFLAHQRSAQDRTPLLPFRLFHDRNFALMNAVLMAALFATVGLLIAYTLYLQAVLELSPTQAGLMLAPPSLATLIISPLAGRLADRVSPRLIFGLGLSLFAAGFVLLALFSDGRTNALALLPGMILCGVGAGAVFAPANTLAMREVPPELTGAASGVVSTLRQVGTVLGTTVVGAILQTETNLVQVLPAALYTVVAVLLATAVAAWWTRRPTVQHTPI
ncbi:MFS transporter [Nonomuraea diastatica]|uniref:DHA2 family efflux MFS transporter permease subunit n=1 Tax=Nonomuraea diastatica TaxID=1848329 RepID=A0A4R4WVE0_9ACTN|nr:MFS transporter [Nonomuraea diastatica]TDD21615.1 DHA2 family efflux MFS transporter permease subunit [Nonomuraea diastatica]